VIRLAYETVGPFQENSYLVYDDASRRAVLVDPGDEPETLLAMVARSGATLDAIWLTHAHLDHVCGINGVRRKFDVPVYLHPLDRPLYDDVPRQGEQFGLRVEQPDPPNAELAEGDMLTVGDARFTVLHTPGHSPGHVIFQHDDFVIGGDLLFRGSIGRTDLPFSNGADMERSLARIAGLPDALPVFPGHGPSTTIADELADNPFLNGTVLPVHR
jgi:glyoxylase-like metal-dependent hydrolase (beta-lactamase superfamily II)